MTSCEDSLVLDHRLRASQPLHTILLPCLLSPARPHQPASAAPPLNAPLPLICSDEGVGQGRGREAFPTLSHDRAPHATKVQVSGGAAEAVACRQTPSQGASHLVDPTRHPSEHPLRRLFRSFRCPNAASTPALHN